MRQTTAFLVAFAFLTTSALADLSEGLVLYMPLDEGGGKTTADLSPNGMVGELMGNAEWVDGYFEGGKALHFSAASDHVVVPDHEAFHIEGAITQAAWVKLDNLPGAHSIIFGTRGGGGRAIGFGYGMNGSNAVKVWTNAAGGGFLDINYNNPDLPVNEWVHIAYTHTSDNNGQVIIYVNGEAKHDQKSNNPVAPAATPSAVQIGTWSGERWPGTVDEVALWNRALSGNEIMAAMETSKQAFLSVNPNGKAAAVWGALKRQ